MSNRLAWIELPGDKLGTWKNANMSSLQADKYRASNAVDGNADDMMIFGEEYRWVYSQKENNPYLEIVLEKELEIRKVVIVNRQDCYSSFLDNFDIVIGFYNGGTNNTCGVCQNNLSNIARKNINCFCGVCYYYTPRETASDVMRSVFL